MAFLLEPAADNAEAQAVHLKHRSWPHCIDKWGYEARSRVALRDLIAIQVRKGRDDASVGFRGKAGKGAVSEIVLEFEGEEEAADLPRMRATMTADQKMSPATQALQG
jgi:hypothetical protein